LAFAAATDQFDFAVGRTTFVHDRWDHRMPALAASSPAVLFDIDGTLVDSNYLHVHAWCRAFREAGMAVESWRIHRAIGMDGSRLVKSLSGGADETAGQRASQLHSRYYAELSPLLSLLPGARELLDQVASRGMQVVLATSAPEDELARLRSLLDCEDLVSAITSSEDVDTAKPEPDIVTVALDRAGVQASRAVFVGDSVWDAQAAARAGVISIGVRSGGVSGEELQRAGATMVFDNPQDLCEHVETSAIGQLR
jgi:HAD superfamily hydrolase (TIGR01509 family)